MNQWLTKQSKIVALMAIAFLSSPVSYADDCCCARSIDALSQGDVSLDARSTCCSKNSSTPRRSTCSCPCRSEVSPNAIALDASGKTDDRFKALQCLDSGDAEIACNAVGDESAWVEGASGPISLGGQDCCVRLCRYRL